MKNLLLKLIYGATILLSINAILFSAIENSTRSTLINESAYVNPIDGEKHTGEDFFLFEADSSDFNKFAAIDDNIAGKLFLDRITRSIEFRDTFDNKANCSIRVGELAEKILLPELIYTKKTFTGLDSVIKWKNNLNTYMFAEIFNINEMANITALNAGGSLSYKGTLPNRSKLEVQLASVNYFNIDHANGLRNENVKSVRSLFHMVNGPNLRISKYRVIFVTESGKMYGDDGTILVSSDAAVWRDYRIGDGNLVIADRKDATYSSTDRAFFLSRSTSYARCEYRAPIDERIVDILLEMNIRTVDNNKLKPEKMNQMSFSIDNITYYKIPWHMFNKVAEDGGSYSGIISASDVLDIYGVDFSRFGTSQLKRQNIASATFRLNNYYLDGRCGLYGNYYSKGIALSQEATEKIKSTYTASLQAGITFKNILSETIKLDFDFAWIDKQYEINPFSIDDDNQNRIDDQRESSFYLDNFLKYKPFLNYNCRRDFSTEADWNNNGVDDDIENNIRKEFPYYVGSINYDAKLQWKPLPSFSAEMRYLDQVLTEEDHNQVIYLKLQGEKDLSKFNIKGFHEIKYAKDQIKDGYYLTWIDKLDSDTDSIDSDGDGYVDGQERELGTDPYDKSKTPNSEKYPPKPSALWFDESDEADVFIIDTLFYKNTLKNKTLISTEWRDVKTLNIMLDLAITHHQLFLPTVEFNQQFDSVFQFRIDRKFMIQKNFYIEPKYMLRYELLNTIPKFFSVMRNQMAHNLYLLTGATLSKQTSVIAGVHYQWLNDKVNDENVYHRMVVVGEFNMKNSLRNKKNNLLLGYNFERLTYPSYKGWNNSVHSVYVRVFAK